MTILLNAFSILIQISLQVCYWGYNWYYLSIGTCSLSFVKSIIFADLHFGFIILYYKFTNFRAHPVSSQAFVNTWLRARQWYLHCWHYGDTTVFIKLSQWSFIITVIRRISQASIAKKSTQLETNITANTNEAYHGALEAFGRKNMGINWTLANSWQPYFDRIMQKRNVNTLELRLFCENLLTCHIRAC